MDFINEFLSETFSISMSTFSPFEITLFHPVIVHLLPWGSVTLYLIVIFCLPKYLNPKGYNIEIIMALWNLFLSIGSFIMLLGLSLPYIKYAQQHGLYYLFCDENAILLTPGSFIFWSYCFALSKYAELLDTLWLVIKKPGRKIDFLHWYHHVTVLLFSWYSIYWKWPVSLYFGCINAAIHTVMYFYYFLTTPFLKVPRYYLRWNFYLTLAQIGQMILGILLTTVWAVRKFIKGDNCYCENPNILLVSCIVMYSSYLYLFVKFLIQRYFTGKKEGKQEKKEV
jgi:hypothetical protein